MSTDIQYIKSSVRQSCDKNAPNRALETGLRPVRPIGGAVQACWALSEAEDLMFLFLLATQKLNEASSLL